MTNRAPLAQRDPSVAVVIPAFNEADYILPVLEAVRQATGLTRIIVVDDGSTDGTAEVVRAASAGDPRVQAIRLPVNYGKAAAIVTGIGFSECDVIVLLDADLVGLQPQHIEDLIAPVRSGEYAMALGLFRRGRFQTDISHVLTPYLSGQRCLRWPLFRTAPELSTARAGVEVALSLHAQRSHYPVKRVRLAGVTHVMKTEKAGRLRGLWQHLRMFAEVGRYLVRQFFPWASDRRLTRPDWVGGGRDR